MESVSDGAPPAKKPATVYLAPPVAPAVPIAAPSQRTPLPKPKPKLSSSGSSGSKKGAPGAGGKAPKAPGKTAGSKLAPSPPIVAPRSKGAAPAGRSTPTTAAAAAPQPRAPAAVTPEQKAALCRTLKKVLDMVAAVPAYVHFKVRPARQATRRRAGRSTSDHKPANALTRHC